MLWNIRLDPLSVCRSVHKVYCGETADWMQMPFGVVRGVSRGMAVLDGVVIVEGKGAVLGVDLGHPIVTNAMGTLLHSCARATRSSQMTLRRTC